MTILDIILAIPLCFFIYKGFRKGLVYELAALAGLLLGIFAAIRFSTFIAELLGMEGSTSVLVAFFITFIGVVILSYFVGKFADGILKILKLSFLNKVAGAVFGMLKCVCILSVLLYYITYIDFKEEFITSETKESSILYKPVEKAGNMAIGSIKEYVEKHRSAEQSAE